MDKKLNDILADIKKIKNSFNVFVPSLQTEVEVNAMTLAQQKTIIESSVDSSLAVLFFNVTFTKILNENFKRKLSEVNVVDRVSFALGFRKQLKNIINVDGNDYNVSDILDANKNKVYDLPSQIISTDNFKIHVNVPNLEIDNKINNILLKKYKDETPKTKFKSLISDLYSYEIFKFIDILEVNSTGDRINLKEDVSKGIELIESLGSSEFVGVIEYINKVRDIEKEYTRVPGTDNFIDILPDFFVV